MSQASSESGQFRISPVSGQFLVSDQLKLVLGQFLSKVKLDQFCFGSVTDQAGSVLGQVFQVRLVFAQIRVSFRSG